MSDYRNPDAPPRRDFRYDSDARSMNATWGWVAAAVFLVVVLAVAFGVGHRPGPLGTNTAANEASAPAATRMAPPATNPGPNTTTAPAPSGTTLTPITPTPNSPAQRTQP